MKVGSLQTKIYGKLKSLISSMKFVFHPSQTLSYGCGFDSSEYLMLSES